MKIFVADDAAAKYLNLNNTAKDGEIVLCPRDFKSCSFMTGITTLQPAYAVKCVDLHIPFDFIMEIIVESVMEKSYGEQSLERIKGNVRSLLERTLKLARKCITDTSYEINSRDNHLKKLPL